MNRVMLSPSCVAARLPATTQDAWHASAARSPRHTVPIGVWLAGSCRFLVPSPGLYGHTSITLREDLRQRSSSQSAREITQVSGHGRRSCPSAMSTSSIWRRRWCTAHNIPPSSRRCMRDRPCSSWQPVSCSTSRASSRRCAAQAPLAHPRLAGTRSGQDSITNLPVLFPCLHHT